MQTTKRRSPKLDWNLLIVTNYAGAITVQMFESTFEEVCGWVKAELGRQNDDAKRIGRPSIINDSSPVFASVIEGYRNDGKQRQSEISHYTVGECCREIE